MDAANRFSFIALHERTAAESNLPPGSPAIPPERISLEAVGRNEGIPPSVGMRPVSVYEAIVMRSGRPLSKSK